MSSGFLLVWWGGGLGERRRQRGGGVACCLSLREVLGAAFSDAALLPLLHLCPGSVPAPFLAESFNLLYTSPSRIGFSSLESLRMFRRKDRGEGSHLGFVRSQYWLSPLWSLPSSSSSSSSSPGWVCRTSPGLAFFFLFQLLFFSFWFVCVCGVCVCVKCGCGVELLSFGELSCVYSPQGCFFWTSPT